MKRIALITILLLFMSGCSTLRYYLDDTQIQALQDNVDAIKKDVKAKLEKKVEEIKLAIDEAREAKGAELKLKIEEAKAKIEALKDKL